MKQILMTRDDNASTDGINIRRYRAGERPSFPDPVSDALIAAGSATEIPDQAELDLQGSTSPAALAAGARETGEVDPDAGGGVGREPAAPVETIPAPVVVILPQAEAPAPVSAQPRQRPVAPATAAVPAKVGRNEQLAKARAARTTGSLSGRQNKSLSKDEA